MTSLPPHQTPAWQIERAALLHRACKSVRTRINRGQKISLAIRRVAKHHNGRRFKCDRTRRLALSVETLRRHFATWKHGGEVRAAFTFQYRPRWPAITAPVLVRFAAFCASQRLPSMKEAWQKFSARGGSFGRGQHAGKPLKISYNQLCYHFPAADFYLFQRDLKAIQAAQMNLAKRRCKVIADIRGRLPDRPLRRRTKRETDFQI